MTPNTELLAYHAAGKPLVCDLDASPYRCEFWPVDALAKYNHEYNVPEFAPGYLGFATSGGVEMFAFAPSGEVVCLPFIVMAPAAALPVASSWTEFEAMLRDAL